MEEVRSL